MKFRYFIINTTNLIVEATNDFDSAKDASFEPHFIVIDGLNGETLKGVPELGCSTTLIDEFI
jgi:hypothetical protein